MKHAMTHSQTRKYLHDYSKSSPWLILGYFFHDRGSGIHKSVRGFLCEILYQILSRHKKMFLQLKTRMEKSVQDPGTDWKWTLEALAAIGRQSNIAFNLCLFVDALDEHDGNLRHLLEVLDQLAGFRTNPLIRVRLCVASRSENVFREKFKACPGFSIDHRTVDDVQAYAHGRLQAEMETGPSHTDGKRLEALVSGITEKAQGVFLWVRLVVDEFIEGLCEGDSLKELTDLLSGIPSELQDLYTRIISRQRRVRKTGSTFQLETYIMFQIANETWDWNAFPLLHVLAAALHLSTGRRAYSELEILSIDQLERRLHSRSCRLLETTGSDSVLMGVQYIHRIVKEYTALGPGATIITEGVPPHHRESRNSLLFRYFVHPLSYFVPTQMTSKSKNS
jgi:hypothetical protein